MGASMKQQQGFTLIELMIVMAIIAILTAIAYPSYQDSVRKARRGDAQADMLQMANFMERKFTEDGSYADVTVEDTGVTSDDFYTFTLTVPAPPLPSTTYVLMAAPNGAQTEDTCKTLSLSNTGEKKATDGGSEILGCW